MQKKMLPSRNPKAREARHVRKDSRESRDRDIEGAERGNGMMMVCLYVFVLQTYFVYTQFNNHHVTACHVFMYCMHISLLYNY